VKNSGCAPASVYLVDVGVVYSCCHSCASFTKFEMFHLKTRRISTEPEDTIW
jgi:hypothetical protein